MQGLGGHLPPIPPKSSIILELNLGGFNAGIIQKGKQVLPNFLLLFPRRGLMKLLTLNFNPKLQFPCNRLLHDHPRLLLEWLVFYWWLARIVWVEQLQVQGLFEHVPVSLAFVCLG